MSLRFATYANTPSLNGGGFGIGGAGFFASTASLASVAGSVAGMLEITGETGEDTIAVATEAAGITRPQERFM